MNLALQPHLARMGGGNPDCCLCGPRSQAGRFSKALNYNEKRSHLETGRPQGASMDQPLSCSRKRWASSAAMQPVPALVMAWR